jgi:hypothetical protein
MSTAVIYCQDVPTDINVLIQETQKLSPKPDEVTLVWWLPEEFWKMSFASSGLDSSQADSFLKVVNPYLIVIVVDGNSGPFGAVTYKSESSIRESIQCSDNSGTRYHPLREEQINSDMKNFLLMMKPILSNMLGPMGQNMHFVLFPAKNDKGVSLLDAKKEGIFIIKLGEREFKWRLPIGSLLPMKTCPVDGEKMNGAWKYCPWHGSKLLDSTPKEPKTPQNEKP